MAEPYPFDRPFWIVSVSFPARHAPPKLPPHRSRLLRRAEAIAAQCGGSPYVYSHTSDMEAIGATFSTALAFEAGDTNAYTAMRRIAGAFKGHGVAIDFDPEDVTYPADWP